MSQLSSCAATFVLHCFHTAPVKTMCHEQSWLSLRSHWLCMKHSLKMSRLHRHVVLFLAIVFLYHLGLLLLSLSASSCRRTIFHTLSKPRSQNVARLHHQGHSGPEAECAWQGQPMRAHTILARLLLPRTRCLCCVQKAAFGLYSHPHAVPPQEEENVPTADLGEPVSQPSRSW